MSDPRSYQIPTETELDCESCGWTNTVDVWDNIRTGAWDYTFECASCGRHNTDHGNALDRGAAEVIVILWATAAVLFLIGGINLLGGHFSWWPLALAGAVLAYGTTVIALFMGAKQGANDHE
jgi:hypothetical protein